jgi:lysophospholipid acyltransferase (LPLAT)-like uncharacterized protein
MRLDKRLVRASATRRVVSWLAYLYMRFVYATTRWTVDGDEPSRTLVNENKPCIACFWHGRMLMLPMGLRRFSRTLDTPRTLPVHVLISAHGDGRAISDAIRYTGLKTIEGSTNDGGAKALRDLVSCLKAREYIGITPDGPNGPAMRATIGVIVAAKIGGVPIVPFTYATSRRRILDTWDRFHLPLPFGHGVFLWGEPIIVPTDLDQVGLETWRALVEARMNALTAEADRRAGREIVRPGTLTRGEWRSQRRTARTGGA